MSDDTGKFILQADQLASKVQQWKGQGMHVLSPAIQMSTFAPGFGVTASLVMLDPTVDERGRGLDVYFDKATLKDTERGLSKIALGRIASAAGVSWLPQSGRCDNFTIQNFWIYRAVGAYMAYDGTPQTIHGEKEIDYRDGSAQIGEWTPEKWAELQRKNQALPQGAKQQWSINGWSEARVRQARTNGAERAETGAMERAIRMGFGIKHAYTLEELKHPFVALRVTHLPNMADAGVRAAVTELHMGGVAALFGHTSSGPRTSRALNAAPQAIDIVPVRQAERVEAPREPVKEPIAKEQPQRRQEDRPQQPAVKEPEPIAEPDDYAVPPPPPGAFYIQDCVVEERKYKTPKEKNGKMLTHYRKWTVVGAGGVQATTVFPKWGELAMSCYQDSIPVTWQLGEPSSYGEQEILNLAAADAAENADTQTEAARL
jgi:hypothetical protein